MTSTEYICLEKNISIPNKSKLLELDPFLDNEGLIRVGGRMSLSDLSYSAKHPIILKGGYFTSLLLDYTHVKLFHAGVNLTMRHIRAQFWIISLRREVSKTIHKCLHCYRWKVKSVNQIMSDLPSTRVKISPAFENTSLDYTGFFLTRTGLPRSKTLLKSYVAIFICHSTKAVHFDVVQDLTTKSFVQCLCRFQAHHGLPKRIFSDNATTFVKAGKDLKELFDFLAKSHDMNFLLNYLNVKGTEWVFQLPYSPFRSGLVERTVQTFKFHLKRTLYNQVLTFNELLTLCYQLESVLNSRPLCLTGDSPTNYEVLTPQHLISGHNLSLLPIEPSDTKELSQIHRYQALNRYLSRVWGLWSNDYLQSLHRRAKWRQQLPPLKVGDIVLYLQHDAQPPYWPLAKVVNVFAVYGHHSYS